MSSGEPCRAWAVWVKRCPLLLVGFVIARFGVRRITELSLGGVGACFLLIGQGATLLALKVSLAFQGFFGGFSRSSLPAYLVALYPSHKRKMISAPVDLRFRHGHRDSAVGQPAFDLVSGGGRAGIGQAVLLALSGRRVRGPLQLGPAEFQQAAGLPKRSNPRPTPPAFARCWESARWPSCCW